MLAALEKPVGQSWRCDQAPAEGGWGSRHDRARCFRADAFCAKPHTNANSFNFRWDNPVRIRRRQYLNNIDGQGQAFSPCSSSGLFTMHAGSDRIEFIPDAPQEPVRVDVYACSET